MAKHMPQCWSCMKPLRESGSGLSLNGSTTPHVCIACWKKIPVYRRVQLMAFYRSVDDGGLGIREAILPLIPMWQDRN